MLDTVVFVGPSLLPRELPTEANMQFLPPAAAGDVHQASIGGVKRIGLIDGYFEDRASVWHKEILFALSNGIEVYGSSSMGALRAAELSAFGMVGIGKVFNDYAAGKLEDDAEVAVLHGPRELGYPPLTVAHADVCSIAESMFDTGTITQVEMNTVIQASASMYFKLRTWSALYSRIRSISTITPELEKVLTVDGPSERGQKATDALNLISTLRKLGPKKKPKYCWSLEDTEWWYAMRSRRTSYIPDDEHAEGIYSLMLDIIRLSGRFEEIHAKSTMTVFASELAGLKGVNPSRQLLQNISDSFRLKRELEDTPKIQKWMNENHMDEHGFTDMVELEARLGHVTAHYADNIANTMVLECKRQGWYPDLYDSARVRYEQLNSMGKFEGNDSVDATERKSLLDWYFNKHISKEAPKSISNFSARLGYDSVDEFYIGLARYKYFKEDLPWKTEK